MIERYSDKYKNAWDNFVLKESCNGTFLQTRNFLEYHPADRFMDCSLIFMKGTNIIAVIPASLQEQNSKKTMISHAGSTFGGIVLGRQYKKISDLDMIFDELTEYLIANDFSGIDLKMTSNLYSYQNMDVLDYYLLKYGFFDTAELGYYIDLTQIHAGEFISSFNGSRRRGLKKALKNEMVCNELITDEEMKMFYGILCNNMEKFDTKPVHTLAEILEFKNKRLCDIVKFYGIFKEEELIAGSMVFNFNNKQVFHTQYLASDQNKLEFYPSEFLYYSLIRQAKADDYHYISFGTSTLEHGKVLNKGLAQFKEGFGTEVFVNRTYHKSIRR